MKTLRRKFLLVLSAALGLTIGSGLAQDFSQIWQVGIEDDVQLEFSQEAGPNPPPGSPTAQDDDYYFAGTYPAPIGNVGVDEAFVNVDRALTAGDTINRIHFNLSEVEAASDTELRVTVDLCCSGGAAGITVSHDVSFKFNGNEFHSVAELTGDLRVEETRTAGELGAVVGANTLEIERTGTSDSSWIQFDFLRLEYTAGDTDGDGIPDIYENDYEFLDPNNAADGEADEDDDGLTNLGEFLAESDPTNPDSDGDTLLDGAEVNDHGSSPIRSDTDGDGLTDADEVNTHNTDPTLADTDGDSLSDAEEINTHQTNPNLADSDADGIDDPTEIELGTDPNDAEDVPVLYTDMWQLGADDNANADFTQEQASPEAPGSAEALDDDYYFVGVYPDPIGEVLANEATLNFERALTSGNTSSRLHFVLDEIQANPDSEFRFTVDLYGLGPEGEGLSVHDLVLLLNGVEFASATGIAGPHILTGTIRAGDANAVEGPNVFEIQRTGQTDGSWIQFDYIKAEYRALDNDRDGMPNTYEARYGFLDPNDPSDAELDEDEDGLNNLDEFVNQTLPEVADTDQDGLNDGDEVNTHSTNPRVADTDGDSLLDGSEVNQHETDPLLADSDADGLSDSEEVTLSTDPTVADTDDDGESDHAEVIYGTDPLNPDSVPLPYETLWMVGIDDDNQAEFVQEVGGSAPAPGSAAFLDDDYYIAGDYDPPIGSVVEDEEWTFFERALTDGNTVSRIHFNLNEEQASASSQIKLTYDMDLLGSAAPPSIHDIAIYFNGTQLLTQTDIEDPIKFEPSFLAGETGAVVGPNVVEIVRTGGTVASWIQFDYVSAAFREVLTDDPNLNVQRRNVFGEVAGPGTYSVDLQITNNGQNESLNISGAAITGPDAAHYSVGTVPETIEPGGSATITVTFNSEGQVGGFAAFLELSSDDVSDPVVSVDLSALVPNANGLIAHYRLDETSGTQALDSSGRGRHGEYKVSDAGAFTLGEPALAGTGSAVHFTTGDTGGAFAEIPDTFDPLGDTSISLWFQVDPGSTGTLTLLSKNLVGAQGDPFVVAYSAGNLIVFTGGVQSVTIPGVSAGEPHHVAVAFDNNETLMSTRVYLNGEKVADEPGDGFDDAQGVSPVVIGAFGGSFGFKGVIDDVQVYNVAITDEDVAYLQANPGEVLEGEVIVDPDMDSDGDGMTDADEVVAGTDPNDQASYLRVTETSRSETGVGITWSAVAGKSYVVEYSPSLEADSWTDIGSVEGDGETAIFTDEDATRIANSSGYYRVRVE